MNTLKYFLVLLLSLLAILPGMAAPKKKNTGPMGEGQIEKNLALIPPTDPPATNPPQLLDSVKGKHPRLLFTAAEIDEMKKRIAADPFLKKILDDTVSNIGNMKNPAASAQSIVSGDTPALASANGRLASAAYVYALTGDQTVKQGIIDLLKAMLDAPHWATVGELDSSMGAACNMYMTAVLFDTVYNDLEPELRAKLAEKILTHARRLYYLGFERKLIGGIRYWQNDPFNNHRWYRTRGLVSSMLAIADEKGLETGFLLQFSKEQMDFLTQWFPPEGDCHEGSGYQRFGFRSLLEPSMMCDRVLGTQYLKVPGFRHSWEQQVYYWIPASQSSLTFGDASSGRINYGYDNPPFFISPRVSRDKNIQAMLMYQFKNLFQTTNRFGKAAPYPWTFLLAYDPTVGEGDYKAVPLYHLFSDMGAASMRDSWDSPDAVVWTFKCGPYGGYKMNEFRHSNPNAEGDPSYVNIAHDDPDANSIAMAAGDSLIFHPGTYSTKKMTNTISTIIVDGKGQLMEGSGYTQPAPKFDMRTLSYLTGWKADAQGRIIVEGEAGNAYRQLVSLEPVPAAVPAEAPKEEEPSGETPDNKDAVADPSAGQPAEAAAPKETKMSEAKTPPPAKIITPTVLKKFRRTTIWMPGEYILVLDDVVADGPRNITWLGTVEKAFFDNPAEGRCHIIGNTGKRVDFQILGDKPFSGATDYLFLAGRFDSTRVEQFQFSAKTDAIRFACLIDAWNKKAGLTMKANGDTVTLTVRSAAFEDTWTWRRSKDDRTPSNIECKRGGTSLIALTEKDKAPVEVGSPVAKN